MDQRGPTEQVGDKERRPGIDATNPLLEGGYIDHISILQGVAFPFGAAVLTAPNLTFILLFFQYVMGYIPHPLA